MAPTTSVGITGIQNVETENRYFEIETIILIMMMMNEH